MTDTIQAPRLPDHRVTVTEKDYYGSLFVRTVTETFGNRTVVTTYDDHGSEYNVVETVEETPAADAHHLYKPSTRYQGKAIMFERHLAMLLRVEGDLIAMAKEVEASGVDKHVCLYRGLVDVVGNLANRVSYEVEQ